MMLRCPFNFGLPWKLQSMHAPICQKIWNQPDHYWFQILINIGAWGWHFFSIFQLFGHLILSVFFYKKIFVQNNFFPGVLLFVQQLHLCLDGMCMKRQFLWFWYPWGEWWTKFYKIMLDCFWLQLWYI